MARLRVIHDDMAIDPRENFDHLGTMVCWHRRYNLGDKHSFDSPGDFMDWLRSEYGKNGYIILPVYMYDHSGIALSTSRSYPFNDSWDAGQVGWIYVTKEKVRSEYSVNRVTRLLREKVLDVLVSEVELYSDYVSGNVWGFEVYEVCTCDKCHCGREEFVDSCFGFYGDIESSGLLDAVESLGIDIENIDDPEVVYS